MINIPHCCTIHLSNKELFIDVFEMFLLFQKIDNCICFVCFWNIRSTVHPSECIPGLYIFTMCLFFFYKTKVPCKNNTTYSFLRIQLCLSLQNFHTNFPKIVEFEIPSNTLFKFVKCILKICKFSCFQKCVCL